MVSYEDLAKEEAAYWASKDTKIAPAMAEAWKQESAITSAIAGTSSKVGSVFKSSSSSAGEVLTAKRAVAMVTGGNENIAGYDLQPSKITETIKQPAPAAAAADKVYGASAYGGSGGEGTDWTTIAVIAAVGAAAYLLFKK